MIRPIAICVFRHRGKILVSEGIDVVKKNRYARPLGAGIETGETSAEAIIREVREEIREEITHLTLLGVLENIFSLNGAPRHEIVFVYDAAFVDHSVYTRSEVPIREPGWDSWDSPAIWRSLDSFDAQCRLVSEALAAMLEQTDTHKE
jgi:ADP-ribose pyrophosphatase YjhB (NUDIX family)